MKAGGRKREGRNRGILGVVGEGRGEGGGKGGIGAFWGWWVKAEGREREEYVCSGRRHGEKEWGREKGMDVLVEGREE